MMMKSNFVAFLLVLTLLLISSFTIESAISNQGYCGAKCRVRCSKAGMQDRCLKYCGVCCSKCNCVPSGTYGNKHQCPCYRDMINSKGKPKCP